MASLDSSQAPRRPFESQAPTRSMVGSITSMPPASSATLPSANMVSWSGSSLKLTVIPVAAVNAGNTFSASAGYPAQPVKLTSPDEAKAFDEIIAGAASRPAPAADPCRNRRRLKAEVGFFTFGLPGFISRKARVVPDCSGSSRRTRPLDELAAWNRTSSIGGGAPRAASLLLQTMALSTMLCLHTTEGICRGAIQIGFSPHRRFDAEIRLFRPPNRSRLQGPARHAAPQNPPPSSFPLLFASEMFRMRSKGV